MVARARAQVDEAGRLAAERLARAAADAPDGGRGGRSGRPRSRCASSPSTSSTDPDGFVAPLGEWGDGVADMRYTVPHDVPFAGALGGEAGHADGAGSRRLAGLGDVRIPDATRRGRAGHAGRRSAAVAAGATVIGRHRRRTALALVGLDEDELRRRRDEFGGSRRSATTCWVAVRDRPARQCGRSGARGLHRRPVRRVRSSTGPAPGPVGRRTPRARRAVSGRSTGT